MLERLYTRGDYYHFVKDLLILEINSARAICLQVSINIQVILTVPIEPVSMKQKLKSPALLSSGLFIFFLFTANLCSAQNDTIRVLAYNTLGFVYSNGCQGPYQPMFPELKAIFQFAKPDIMGLDKMACVQTNRNNLQGISPYYFPDTIISECLDTNYSFCPFTDISGCNDGDGSVLFYNHSKIGYVSTTPMYTGQEDIDLFKLYYRDPYLSATQDTTFLYVILCHTISGNSSSGRDGQDTTVMNKLKTMFTYLPNLIYMGDFNTHSTGEPGYAYITQTDADTNFLLDDPCFHPDAKLVYPIDWDNNPTACAAELTTTTRSTTLPNSCGTTGGGKDWYDHIFLSHPIVNNADYISYILNSYTTIGNDGRRIGVSVNTGTNLSAPANVLNALFNFSDKYPVMVSLLAAAHPLGVVNILQQAGSIKVTNPVIDNTISLHFASYLNGQNMAMGVYDICGRLIYQYTFNVNNTTINKEISLVPGVYILHFTSGGYGTTLKVVKE
jgi:hypothetical protein